MSIKPFLLPGLAAALSIPVTHSAKSAESVFLPSHDAYTQDGGNHNNGELRVENSGRHRIIFLQFDLGTLAGAASSATLHLTGGSDKTSGDMTIRVFAATSNEWDELDISDETAPELGEELSSYEGNIEIGQEVEFDVTSLITGPGIYSLIIEADDSPLDVSFVSKEGEIEEDHPRLVVTVSESSLVPVITASERDAASGAFSFSWTSTPGLFYSVDASDTLEGDWLELDDSIEGTADISTYVDEGAGESPVRYYRVRLVSQ